MRTEDLTAWVEGYRRAWDSNDPADIGALFTPDALYYTEPYAQPHRGREAIVADWLERKDEPADYEFSYEPLAIQDDLGFVQGWTRYLNPPRRYSNLWVIRLDEQGQCREFTEWWMEHK